MYAADVFLRLSQDFTVSFSGSIVQASVALLPPSKLSDFAHLLSTQSPFDAETQSIFGQKLGRPLVLATGLLERKLRHRTVSK